FLPGDVIRDGLLRRLWPLCGAFYKVVNFHGRFAAGVRLFDIDDRIVAVPERYRAIGRNQVVVGFLLVLYPDNGLRHHLLLLLGLYLWLVLLCRLLEMLVGLRELGQLVSCRWLIGRLIRVLLVSYGFYRPLLQQLLTASQLLPQLSYSVSPMMHNTWPASAG